MSDEAAFLAAISAAPADDTARLVYADWLDDHSDPRGPYLRAECAWAKLWGRSKRVASPELRRLAAQLDSVWVARVSRPPAGVCIQDPLFRRSPPVTEEQIEALAAEFGVIFPPQYQAFLLASNGFSDKSASEDDPFEVLGSVTDVAEYARWLFADRDQSTRRSGLFPIGCEPGVNYTLLGVTYPNTRPSRLFGCVFYLEWGERLPWIDEDGDEIDSGQELKAADSLCELLGNWDFLASH
jgi:uncharacterized protein (TIGR02996 family)